MEEFLKDKIFQYYFHKIYGQKTNYQTFKTFSDKEKISFLINLFLFISDVDNNTNFIKRKEYRINYNLDNEKDNLYQDNYNKIMSEYFNIINKYNEEFHSKPINHTKENQKVTYENEKNKVSKKDDNINLDKNEIYMKNNYRYNSDVDTDNYFEEKKNISENEIIINSKQNDINIKINNKQNFDSGKYNFIINTDSKKNKSKNLIIEENFQKQQNNNENEGKNLRNVKIMNNNNENDNKEKVSSSNELKNNSNINKNSNLPVNINDYNERRNIKSNNQINIINSRNESEKKEIMLSEQTMTEKSFVHLEEFTNDNLVEKLIKCPQNKYISLNCNEANQVALVIINLMESKNDLENEIEEEKKKNEIILNKMKIDFEKQKNEIKAMYNKKENNFLKILGEFEKEINDERLFLEEEEKGYNLWDHVTIENQRTKEIRENIMAKISNFKK